MSEYQLIERRPTVAEYRDLLGLSGLSEKTVDAAESGHLA
jgi:hypothetical protein